MRDLVAAAAQRGHQIKPRLITDWASIGLLDHPEPRGRGRGKGKSYTWPAAQRDLLLTLLRHHGTVHRPVLCNIPVGVWLMFGDEYVPLRQVRRALATWCAKYAQVSFTKAKQGAERALLRLDHPDASQADRDRLRRLLTRLTQGSRVDRPELAEATRRVADPHAIGIVRGVEGLVDAESHIRIIMARAEGNSIIGTAPDRHYYAARRTYLSTNPVAPGGLQKPLEPDPHLLDLSALDPRHPGLNAAANNACLDLITLLGLIHLPRPRGSPPRRGSHPGHARSSRGPNS